MFLFNRKNKNSISVNEIKNILGNVSLIDIREPNEYSSGHIPTARNIPMTNLLKNPDNYLDKSKEYYIVCQSGGRSSLACNFLLKQGYNVFNVSGGTDSYSGDLEY